MLHTNKYMCNGNNYNLAENEESSSMKTYLDKVIGEHSSFAI